jgi:hypothetical protein
MKLWISSGYDSYGLVAVVADTREEAIAKASAKLSAKADGSYVPGERYRQGLLDNLDGMTQIEDGVFIDWDQLLRRRH